VVRVANLAFLKPDFVILAVFGNQKNKKKPEIKKSQTKFGFFSVERLGSGKGLFELHIIYRSLLTRACDHAGCTEDCKGFTVALKMIDVIDKNQM